MKTLLSTTLLVLTLSATSVFAATEDKSGHLLSRDDIKAQAVEMCRTNAEQRYGDDTIKFIARKSIWSKYMDGALVRMKIRPEAKNSKNYYCLVKADKSVDYIVR